MKPPKKKSIIIWQSKSKIVRSEYISVEWLKEWIEKNCDHGETESGVPITIINSDELLKAIEE